MLFPRQHRLIVGSLLGSMTVMMIVVISCHMHRGDDRRLEHMDATLSNAELFSQTHDEQHFALIAKSGDSSQKIAELARSTCEPKSEPGAIAKIDLRILLMSTFGDHVLNVVFSNKPEDITASVTLDKTQMIIHLDAKSTQEFVDEICPLASNGDVEITDDKQASKTLAFFNFVLTRIAPDCLPIYSLQKGIECKLDMRATNSEDSDLKYIKRIMLTRWNRQPYLLSRRLAVALMLAEALATPVPTEGLKNFCKVVGFSSNEELPLAMSTNRWKSAVCSQTNETRLKAAAIGLRKAVLELEFLRQLYEKNAKPGTLRVNLPPDKAPTKDLWISLEPKEDVSQNLKQNSIKENASKAKLAEVGEPKSCWHPLFAESVEILQLARYMQLMNTATGISCFDNAGSLVSTAVSAKMDTYLADCITSESEFVITNGRTKILRLPEGTYRYTIRAHADDLGWETLPDISSSGEIVWSNKKPAASISNW